MKLFFTASVLLLASAHLTFADSDDVDDNPAPGPGSAPAPAPAPGDGWTPPKHPSPHDAPAPNHYTTEEVVTGCTDTAACNFNSLATALDASMCSYPGTNQDCDGNCLPGFPEDCKGVCGGDTACCPETCGASADKAGMSCDQIGLALGSGSSSTTCASLEMTGCDCSGCGCGFIVDEDGYELEDGMVASGLTCDKSLKVTTDAQPCTAAKTCTQSECKDYCSDSSDCEYAGWNTQGGCILYSSCKVTRTVASVTTTFHRVAAGQGVVDDGATCACTWWTCVNDDGLGYCPE